MNSPVLLLVSTLAVLLPILQPVSEKERCALGTPKVLLQQRGMKGLITAGLLDFKDHTLLEVVVLIQVPGHFQLGNHTFTSDNNFWFSMQRSSPIDELGTVRATEMVVVWCYY